MWHRMLKSCFKNTIAIDIYPWEFIEFIELIEFKLFKEFIEFIGFIEFIKFVQFVEFVELKVKYLQYKLSFSLKLRIH